VFLLKITSHYFVTIKLNLMAEIYFPLQGVTT